MLQHVEGKESLQSLKISAAFTWYAGFCRLKSSSIGLCGQGAGVNPLCSQGT